VAEQVRQGPGPAVVCWGHGYVQACPRFPHGLGNWMSCRSHDQGGKPPCQERL
jgi:hypothetical protein